MTNELIITLFCIAMLNVWGAVDTSNTKKEIDYMFWLWTVLSTIAIAVMLFKDYS